MSAIEHCVNCEEPISGIPTYFDGAAYCCYGCVAGGPCVCTYLPTEETTVPSVPPARAYSVPAETPAPPAAVPQPAPVAVPAADLEPEEDPRAPIPFHRGGPVTLTLHLSAMPDQYEILRFAAALDSAPGLEDIALVRMDRTEAWFSVRAVSPELLAAAVMSMRDFHLNTTVTPDAVEATAASSAPQAVPQAAVPTALMQPGERRDDTLLPPRPRFRVFRPAADETPVTPPPSALPPAPVRPAAARPIAEPPAAPAAPAATAAPVRVESVPPVPSVTPRPVARPAASVPAAPAVARPAAVTPPVAAAASTERPAMPVPPAPVSASPTPRVAQAMPAEMTRTAAPSIHEALAERPVAPTPAPAAPRQAERPRLVEPQPSTPIAAAEGADVIAPDERPGGAMSVAEHLTLVVYPFHSFVALNEFQAAVRTLRGVTSTRVRRFYRGTLHLAVDYEDIIPLVERLQEMRSVPFRVVSESRNEIEMVLEEARSLVAAGEG
ncbi:MAG: hypothetical protein AMXMBFR23_26080 [Chloroflexota bacterium]